MADKENPVKFSASSDNGWGEWGRFVLKELERLNVNVETLDSRLQSQGTDIAVIKSTLSSIEQLQKVLQDVVIDLTIIKTKAGVYGGIAGGILAGIILFVKFVVFGGP